MTRSLVSDEPMVKILSSVSAEEWFKKVSIKVFWAAYPSASGSKGPFLTLPTKPRDVVFLPVMCLYARHTNGWHQWPNIFGFVVGWNNYNDTGLHLNNVYNLQAFAIGGTKLHNFFCAVNASRLLATYQLFIINTNVIELRGHRQGRRVVLRTKLSLLCAINRSIESWGCEAGRRYILGSEGPADSTGRSLRLNDWVV